MQFRLLQPGFRLLRRQGHGDLGALADRALDLELAILRTDYPAGEREARA
ncbi:MAG: hypothetical protein ACOY3L_02765 [Pseudomonadota bacterium]